MGRRHPGFRRRHPGRRRRRCSTPASSRDKIGLLVNTSVSRDFLEPSTASIVSGNLGLGENCQNFDVANACLAFLNGMDIASRMIERGEIDYALVVDGETANLVYDNTLQRLLAPDVTEEQFRSELASLTLGCGAAAMVLSRTELCPDAPRYKGGVTKAATEWNGLCRGNLDRMVTDTRMLLIEGPEAGEQDLRRRRAWRWAGWSARWTSSSSTRSSRVHTDALVQGLRHRPGESADHIPRARQHRPGLGADRAGKLRDLGRLKKGHRVALLGIGSGLNCSMAEVVW